MLEEQGSLAFQKPGRSHFAEGNSWEVNTLSLLGGKGSFKLKEASVSYRSGAGSLLSAKGQLDACNIIHRLYRSSSLEIGLL